MLKAILIDKDDTLINIEKYWEKPIIQTSYDIQKEFQLEECVRLLFIECAGFKEGKLIEESPVISGTNQDIIQLFNEKAHMHLNIETYASLIEDNCLKYGDIEAIEDVVEFIQEAKKHHIKLAAVTSDNYLSTLHCLKALHIESMFDEIYSADKLRYPKPNPEACDLFKNKYKLNVEEIIMIGDSLNDMKFADYSHIQGYYFKGENRNYHCFDSFKELKNQLF